MKKITFECETITPMFLAGADGKPELRPPSIKAAMRFWWRAMNADMGSIKKLKEKESEIFGGSGEGEGRSRFDICVSYNITPKQDSNIFEADTAKNPDWYKKSNSSGRDIKVNPLEYLGYGSFNFKDKWKTYIPPDSKFSVVFKYYDECIKVNLETSFKLLSSFGSLGSKSRNGFGNFRIINSSNLDFDILKSDLIPTSYSHISKDVKIFKLKKKYDSWQSTLARLGDIYRFSKLQTDGNKHNYDNRKFIAAPVRQDVFIRKTKPYFLKVNKLNNNTKNKTEYCGFILYLPYCDLSTDNEIYKSGYNSTYPGSLKSACEKLNKEILKFKSEIEEVTL